MRFLSVCSGIEAASVAWEPIGFSAVAFAEYDPAPSAVLAHRFPTVANLGDITKYRDWSDYEIEILVGGTPCQSFSVAGLRTGMADPRGNLALTYLGVADRYRPRWLVWENVPGVLSSSDGRDFGAFLGALAKLGYGFAWRVLDAQYFGVPQRRRRVFVVGHLGDWRPAAAVFFERESLHGDTSSRRKTGKTAPAFVERRTKCDGLKTDVSCHNVAPTLQANFAQKWGLDNQHIDSGAGLFIVHGSQDPRISNNSAFAPGRNHGRENAVFAIQGAATRENPNSGPNGMGCRSDGLAYTLEARSEVQAVAFNMRGREGGNMPETTDLASLRAASGGSSRSFIAARSGVRRLTPRECERLQGFPDDWTLVPYRGKPMVDGPRYKALGNSMAVPVMRWIGERIALVDNLVVR